MPLVLVHGVSVRRDQEYIQNEQARDGLFRNLALDGIVSDPSEVKILNPYWGQYGATFAWDNASLPDQKYESFGSSNDAVEQILSEVAPSITLSDNEVLLSIARESLPRAIDCLWAVAAHTQSDEPVGDDLAVAAKNAVAYAEANQNPEWLKTVTNDDQFTEKLLDAIDNWKPAPGQPEIESFGGKKIWNHFKAAVSNLATRATAIAVNPLVRAARPWVHHKISVFVGDVFVYLDCNKAGTRDKITDEVANALSAADKTRKPGDDKLIVIAHSMGGNITYDILTSVLPNLQVDLYVTVASQVGLFEELKLFRASDKAITGANKQKVKKPSKVTRWINVMDPSDVLAYSTSRIFEASEDKKFETHAPVWSAHSMYFYMPYFHKRLRARLLEPAP